MPWYRGDLPVYLPICHRKREEPFAMQCEIEVWSFQTLLQDQGEGVKPWVQDAAGARKLAMHFFVPGNKVERIWEHQRHLWHKAWREAANYLEFSFYPEPDVWWDIGLMEGRRLQYIAGELGNDMHVAGIPMIWLLLDIKAGGKGDIDKFAGHANRQEMRWVATNLTGARDNTLFREMLEVLAAYHQVLAPKIGVIVNGVGAEKRIRHVLRVFRGREVVFSSNGRIERLRRAL